MKQLAMKVLIGLALVLSLLGGIALGHQASGVRQPAHPQLACGPVYLPPCI